MIQAVSARQPQPLVSVVMATYNAADYLGQAVDSLLSQSLTDFELILIDDASADHTPRLLEQYRDPRLRIVRHRTNLGLTRSLVEGCSQAQGRYIARLDADDLCDPSRLETQARYLDQHPDVAVVGSWVHLIDGSGKQIGQMQPAGEPQAVAWDMCWGSTLCHSSAMIRAEALSDIGGYDPAYRLAQDYELWTRLLMAGQQVCILPIPLTSYRRTPGQIVASRFSEHGRVAMGLLGRYVTWLIGRKPDPAALRAARALLYDQARPRNRCRIDQTVALIAQTLAGWQQRLPAPQAHTLSDHVTATLLRVMQQHTYDAPRFGASLSGAIRQHLPQAANHPAMKRQTARLLWYGARWWARTAPRLATRSIRRNAQQLAKAPGTDLAQRAHRLMVRQKAVRQIEQLRCLREQLVREGAGREIIAIDLIGGMGDILTCEPVARQVRQMHPEAYLVWCVHRSMTDLVIHHPSIDRVIPVDCFGQRRLLAASGMYDEIIDLYIPGWSCPRCNVYKPVRADGMHHSNYYDYGESNLAVMCRAAGISVPDDPPRVYLPGDVVRAVDALGIGQPYVVIHGRSGEAQRDWPAERWQAVAEKLVQARVHVAEVGLSPVIRMVSRYYHNCCGLPVLQAGELIRRAAVFAGVDSGPAHFGNALGVPAVIVLGHFRQFTHRYVPYSGRYRDPAWAELVYADGPLDQLPAEPVLAAIEQRLRQPREIMSAPVARTRASAGA